MALNAGMRLGVDEGVAPLGAGGTGGTGGTGEVYRARDTKLRRDVAIAPMPIIPSASASSNR